MTPIRRLVAAAFAAMLLVSLGATSAMAARDKNTVKVAWEWQGGQATQAGVSQDGPKSSNAYIMDPGSYIAPYNYWGMALSTTTFGLSYKASELTGAGQVYWTVITEAGTYLALDPYHCQSPADAKGWVTVDFKRIGTDCTIYEFAPDSANSWQGDGSYLGGQTAWQKMLTDHGSEILYFSYLIQDTGSADSLTVDRIRADGNVLSLFPKNASPDTDDDGTVDRYDNCSTTANANQADTDGDGDGDACDNDIDMAGTYAGTSNNPVPSFNGSIDLSDTGVGNDGSYVGTASGGAHATPGCYSLSGSISFTFGTHNASGPIDSANSYVCPTADVTDHPDTYTLHLVVNIDSGNIYTSSDASGTVTYDGTQSPGDVNGVRTSTGAISGAIAKA